jgi:CheY-like chemotaxis protein
MVPLGREQTRSFGPGSLAVYFSLTAAGSRFLTLGRKRCIQSLPYGLSSDALAQSRSTELLMTLRIFIVDDSDRVRAAIKSLLNSNSSQWLVCGEAVDGDDAIERAALAMPDVILLDLSLPQVPGTVLAAKLQEAIPSATIVIMSAQDPRLMRQFADSLQVEYFLTKSNLGTDLIPSLENISRKKRSAI